MKDKALQHLQKAGEFHLAMCKVHRDLAEHHEAMVAKGLTADDHHYNIASLHKAAMGHHEAMGTHCAEFGKALLDLPPVDTAVVEAHGDSFGSKDFRAALLDEFEKRFFGRDRRVEPLTTAAVAPSDESLKRTAETSKNRLVGRDGKDPREELEKSAAPAELEHFFK